MHKVLIEIIPRGIIPALRVGNFWIKKTGILGDNDRSVCLKCSIPQIFIRQSHWLDRTTFEMLSEIPFVCTGQDFFQLLCTTIVEAILFGMVHWTGTVHRGYVFLFDFCLWCEFYNMNMTHFQRIPSYIPVRFVS